MAQPSTAAIFLWTLVRLVGFLYTLVVAPKNHCARGLRAALSLSLRAARSTRCCSYSDDWRSHRSPWALGRPWMCMWRTSVFFSFQYHIIHSPQTSTSFYHFCGKIFLVFYFWHCYISNYHIFLRPPFIRPKNHGLKANLYGKPKSTTEKKAVSLATNRCRAHVVGQI